MLFSCMKFFLPIVFLLGFCGAAAQTKQAMKNLKQQINQVLSQQKGTFAVAFKDLSSGKELLINARENFHAASTMKTPVMIEVFKQVADGRFSLSDSFVIKNKFKSTLTTPTTRHENWGWWCRGGRSHNHIDRRSTSWDIKVVDERRRKKKKKEE